MVHIDIRFLRNKFDMLTNGITEYIDILMISETKLKIIHITRKNTYLISVRAQMN